jgi:hypothetical protein
MAIHHGILRIFHLFLATTLVAALEESATVSNYSSASFHNGFEETTTTARVFGESSSAYMAVGIGGLLFFLVNFWRAEKDKKSNPVRHSVRNLVSASLVLVAAAAFQQLDTTAILSNSVLVFQSLLGWYMMQLETNPLATKSLTTSCIQFIGDFFAQAVEEFRIQRSTQQSFNIFRLQTYELRRGLSLAADGMLLSGPLLHYVYGWMEDNYPTADSAVTAAFHVLVNDLLVDTFYLFVSFIFVAIVEGHWKDLPTIFRKDFVDTVKASWGSSFGFMPIEYVSFRYLPVHFRVLAMNFVDIVWGAIISFTAHRSRNEMKECA